MEEKQKYERIEHEFDPRRCQALIRGSQQCGIVQVPGSKYCQIHGGNKIEEKQRKEKLDMYRLTKYQTRLKEFNGGNEIKNLKNEVGILRIVLEEIFNQCNGSAELICYSSKISDLAGQIEKLVSSTHKLDLSLGQYLDKTQALNLVDIILKIIDSVSIEESIKEKISEMILSETTKAIETAQKEIMK